MKLVEIDEELTDEEELMLLEDEVPEFYATQYFDIANDDGEKIGVITGRILFMEEIKQDIEDAGGRNFYIELDAESALLNEVAEFIQQNHGTFEPSDSVYFLNNVHFFQTHFNKENYRAALKLVAEKYHTVIYSYGSTDLDDPYEFKGYSDADFEVEKSVLEEEKWAYAENYNFYCRSNSLMLLAPATVQKGKDVSEEELKSIYESMSELQRSEVFAAHLARLRTVQALQNFRTPEQWSEVTKGPVTLKQMQIIREAIPNSEFLMTEFKEKALKAQDSMIENFLRHLF